MMRELFRNYSTTTYRVLKASFSSQGISRSSSPSSSSSSTTASPPPPSRINDEADFARSILSYLEAAASSVKPTSQQNIDIDRPWKYLGIRESRIEGAGRGLFLQGGRGVIQAGSILCLYPGLIYEMPQDIERFLPSDDAVAMAPPDFMLGNHYLLRLNLPKRPQYDEGKRDLLVDGRPVGLSAILFKNVYQRKGLPPVNLSWLEDDDGGTITSSSVATAAAAASSSSLRSALLAVDVGHESEPKRWSMKAAVASGHVINDPRGLEDATSNVIFKAARLPPDCPDSLLELVPTLSVSSYFSSSTFSSRRRGGLLCFASGKRKKKEEEGAGGGGGGGGREREERIAIAVIASKDIDAEKTSSAYAFEGQELYVEYGQDPSSIGYM